MSNGALAITLALDDADHEVGTQEHQKWKLGHTHSVLVHLDLRVLKTYQALVLVIDQEVVCLSIAHPAAERCSMGLPVKPPTIGERDRVSSPQCVMCICGANGVVRQRINRVIFGGPAAIPVFDFYA